MLKESRVKELLIYDEKTGVFSWRCNRGGAAKTGSQAGAIDSKGYRQIRVDMTLYLAHRLAWLYVNGSFPDGDLDHIDRNPKNNAIENLRICTHAENHQNVGLRKDSSSGFSGVSFVKASRKWLAYININGKRVRIGLFESIDEAVIARSDAKQKHHSFGAEKGVRFTIQE